MAPTASFNTCSKRQTAGQEPPVPLGKGRCPLCPTTTEPKVEDFGRKIIGRKMRLFEALLMTEGNGLGIRILRTPKEGCPEDDSAHCHQLAWVGPGTVR
jgi:hypothetical protein